MHVNSFHTWLRKFTSQHGLPPISPHKFRHMVATYKIEEGVSVKAVQKGLGHSRISTTDRYTHSFDLAEHDAAQRMESLIERLKRGY